jgi:hypothetical protein
MPINYSYEGPLAQPAYNASVRAGYQQAAEDRRRFDSQQAMQAAMEQQRMQNQRWMQMADQAGSQQNIRAQGAINSGLQQASQGFQREMAATGNQFDTQQQQQRFQLQAEYQQKVMNQELNAIGEQQKRSIDSKMQILQQQRSTGMINDQQLGMAKDEILRRSLDLPWDTYYKQSGKDPGTSGVNEFGVPYDVRSDGERQYFPEMMDPETKYKRNTVYVDKGGTPVPQGTPGAEAMVWEGSRLTPVNAEKYLAQSKAQSEMNKYEMEAIKLEEADYNNTMKIAGDLWKQAQANAAVEGSTAPTKTLEEIAREINQAKMILRGKSPAPPQQDAGSQAVQQHFNNLSSTLQQVTGQPSPMGKYQPPVQVRTLEEAMQLPSGTVVILPDGRRKVRP